MSRKPAFKKTAKKPHNQSQSKGRPAKRARSTAPESSEGVSTVVKSARNASDKGTVRLNKWIAESGLCSRREADRLIESGAVSVNQTVVTTHGTQIRPGKDVITVDGKDLPRQSAKPVYLAFHKPKGVITTRSDEKNRKTIYDILPPKYHHCNPAGRLDRDSSGLLILTNNGDFLYQLTHPKFHLEKRYRVKIRPELKDEEAVERLLQKLKTGVEIELDTGAIQTAQVHQARCVSADTLELTLITGLNRQIRRMLEALKYDVISLKRTNVGTVGLKNMPPGTARHLSLDELKRLQ